MDVDEILADLSPADRYRRGPAFAGEPGPWGHHHRRLSALRLVVDRQSLTEFDRRRSA
jgi:hypothetical protein